MPPYIRIKAETKENNQQQHTIFSMLPSLYGFEDTKSEKAKVLVLARRFPVNYLHKSPGKNGTRQKTVGLFWFQSLIR